MNQYDFKMSIVEGDDGFPVLVIEFGGLLDMDEAEELAEEVFAIMSGEDEQIHGLH